MKEIDSYFISPAITSVFLLVTVLQSHLQSPAGYGQALSPPLHHGHPRPPRPGRDPGQCEGPGAPEQVGCR